jgi:surface antigen
LKGHNGYEAKILKRKPRRNLTRAYKAGKLKGVRSRTSFTTKIAARKLSVRHTAQLTLKRAVVLFKRLAQKRNFEFTIHLKWVWLAVGLFLLYPQHGATVYSDPIIGIEAITPQKPINVPNLTAQEPLQSIYTTRVVLYTTFYSIPVGNTAGNAYAYGQCTYYAKLMRPDMPNNLGNANTWFYNAAAQGFAVGYTPRVGAVAAAIGYMHVAIVTAIHGDGTITVSEENYQGWGVVSSRIAPASEFRYIL